MKKAKDYLDNLTVYEVTAQGKYLYSYRDVKELIKQVQLDTIEGCLQKFVISEDENGNWPFVEPSSVDDLKSYILSS